MRNFLILTVLLLTGCSRNTCIDYTYTYSSSISSNKYKGNFCIKNSVYNTLKEEGKDDSYIFDVATYQYEHIEDTEYPLDILNCRPTTSFNKIMDRIESDEVCLSTWKKGENEYIKYIDNENKKQKELEIAEEKFRQENKKHEQKLKKKSGVDWCDPRSMYAIIQQLRGDLAKNCMFEAGTGGLRVMQQTPEGTLVHTTIDSSFIYFIEKNNKDSQLVDNTYTDGGIFVNIGKYQYTNTLGSLKTVYKLKRIE